MKSSGWSIGAWAAEAERAEEEERAAALEAAKQTKPSVEAARVSEYDDWKKEIAVKPRPKVNPFGDAKPREVSLAEKGLDYKKIDMELDHKRIHRPETNEEKNLKEEIENLKKDSLEKSGEEQAKLQGEIIDKEKALELLIRELDDKVRFGQKNIDRPGSGRYTGPSSRHSQRHGPSQEPRGAFEFTGRPRSRGTLDSYPRQNGDKRTFAGGRDRGGFSGSRELNRSSPRSRW